MISGREKKTFRRGRSRQEQKNFTGNRRRGGYRGGRRGGRTPHVYRKRTKEDEHIIIKQDFFNLGLSVQLKGFEDNMMEEVVTANPDVFLQTKRGLIVDTRLEFKQKWLRSGQTHHNLNSRNKKIGSVLENLIQNEPVPEWYLEDDDEEVGDEILRGTIDRGEKASSQMPLINEKTSKEDNSLDLDETPAKPKLETVAVLESLAHISSDSEGEEWGVNKMEESGLNLDLEEGFTLENLAGQTMEIHKQRIQNKDSLENLDLNQEEQFPIGGILQDIINENEEMIDLKSVSILEEFKGNKENYFEELDKKLEESFFIAKKVELENENKEQSQEQENLETNELNLLEGIWKNEEEDEFLKLGGNNFLGGFNDDSSLDMENMLKEVDNEYQDVFANFESNMNKILYGGSFSSNSHLIEDESNNDDFEDLEIVGQVLEDLDTADSHESKQEKKEMTKEEKEKRKKFFINKYGFMNMMMDNVSRDTLSQFKRKKNQQVPENGMTNDSVAKFTKNNYKIFSMLTQGCMFFKLWFYKDSEGEKKGPFMAFDMDIWNSEGVLKEDFLISPNDKIYLCYEKFIDRDNSVIDLMGDVIREQERILQLDQIKRQSEKLKNKEKKRARGRTRGRGNRGRDHWKRKDSSYNDTGYYKKTYVKEDDYKKRNKYNQYNRGELNFKKRQKEKSFDEKKYEPQHNQFKKKKQIEEVNEEDFPTISEEVSKSTNQTSNFTKKENPNESMTPKNPLMFVSPDEIPEIKKNQASVFKKKPTTKEQQEKRKGIGGWDEIVAIQTVSKKEKKRKKKRGRKKKEERKQLMTNDIKNQLGI